MSATAHADASGKLKNFIANTHTAQANFTQEVLDKNGKRIQSASGIMQFSRPGKFRWTYQKPYEQVIVGDGAKFWLYDVDLNQVTVKKLDAALGSSPAALLAGSNEIERDFALKNVECEQHPAGSSPPPRWRAARAHPARKTGWNGWRPRPRRRTPASTASAWPSMRNPNWW